MVAVSWVVTVVLGCLDAAFQIFFTFENSSTEDINSRTEEMLGIFNNMDPNLRISNSWNNLTKESFKTKTNKIEEMTSEMIKARTLYLLKFLHEAEASLREETDMDQGKINGGIFYRKQKKISFL